MKFVSNVQRSCVTCNSGFLPVSNRQKTCSKACQDERERKEALRRYYEKKDGKFSPQTERSGVGKYRQMVAHITDCVHCGAPAVLTHHKDGNRKNNVLSNLERLCKKCHQVEHNCANNLPSAEVSSESRRKYLRDHPEAKGVDGKFIKITRYSLASSKDEG